MANPPAGTERSLPLLFFLAVALSARRLDCDDEIMTKDDRAGADAPQTNAREGFVRRNARGAWPC